MASDNYLAIHINKTIQLAATIVIKSKDTAQGINNYLSALGVAVDSTDESTWKYYMNMAGEYHSSDTLMRVVSLDTLETIDFTAANLLTHRATARAYQYGTRQYEELLTQYPEQELLIRGILYPIDKATAIAARDGLILGGYPPALVEVNEYSLMTKVQQWVDNYLNRWYNPAYTITDNLYLPFSLGYLYMNLVPAILGYRLEACKTNEAHSFHVRQYLASHGYLDAYLDQLTTKQALILYRNIAYVERNPGQRNIFAWLTQNLLTVRNLPLAEFTMRHDVSAMKGQPYAQAITGLATMKATGTLGATTPPPDTGNTYPTVFFQRTPINLGYSYDTLDTVTLDQMLTKEQSAARDNATYQADVTPEINTEMVNSLSNVLQTKALESAMVDYTDSTPYTMEATLLNHWPWLASKGLYTAVVNVENPRTGERIALPALDAFCLYWYCYCASIGFVFDVIPPFLANHVQRVPLPQESDLMSIVDKQLIPQATATQLLSYSPIIQNTISTEAYYGTCRLIWWAQNVQWERVALEEFHINRGHVENMFHRIYADVWVAIADEGQNYTAWLAERNLDLTGWTRVELALLASNLFNAATGLDLTTTQSVEALQKAMISALSQLSSYSVQYMSYINTGAIIPLAWPMTRQGDYRSQIHATETIHNIAVRLKDFKSQLLSTEEVALFSDSWDTHWKGVLNDRAHLEMTVPVDSHDGETTWYERMDISLQIGYDGDYETGDPELIAMPGMEIYTTLDDATRMKFKDVYGSVYGPTPVSP